MERPKPVNAHLRQLPAVDRLVELVRGGRRLARWSALHAARHVLARAREELRRGRELLPLEELARDSRRRAEGLERPFPRAVINATGVILHTNLGRAPLSAGAAAAIARAAVGYSNLELDLESGSRGSRLEHVVDLLCALSGAAGALVVNNAAAALLLAVDTLAAGREVVISRGELVEIGGSFRVPEILGASRARLREIGTTNRTHLEDYAAAIGPETGLLLKVHRSNFRIEGFTTEVPLPALAALARERGLPLVEDRGSGTFVELGARGIPEREVTAGLSEGADLTVFSGDKLLGGPQAGVALGRGELIDRMRANPLARALRIDKLTLAALDWTLRALLDGRLHEIPVLSMLLAPAEELTRRAEEMASALRAAGWSGVSVGVGAAPVGGGSLPELELPGAVVQIELGEQRAGELAGVLRQGDPPILVRVRRGVICIDPRTLSDTDAAQLRARLTSPPLGPR